MKAQIRERSISRGLRCPILTFHYLGSVSSHLSQTTDNGAGRMTPPTAFVCKPIKWGHVKKLLSITS